MSLYLHGLGHFHPENEITNAFLESLDIGTNEEWIMERVGIRCRRTALPLDYIRETRNAEPRAALEAAEYSQAEMGARAARLALERAGIGPEDVGMVLGGGCAPDTTTPAEACNVAALLGIEAPSLDIASACTSFFAAIRLLAMMRPEELPPFVLLTATEAMTRTVDYRDRATAVLWGDGAAAAVLSTREPAPARVLGSTLVSSPAGADKVVIPRLGHFDQEGRTVQMFAIKKTAGSFEALRAEHGREDRPLHFIGHQANLRMLDSVCRKCGIPEERHHFNVDWFGNTGAASGAGVLSQSWEKFDEHDDVALAGVGAGLTWGSYLVRFGGAE